MNTLLRILTVILLAAILATLIGIYKRMPIEPITVEGSRNI